MTLRYLPVDRFADMDGDVIEVGAVQDAEVIRIGGKEVHLDAKGRARFNWAHTEAGRLAGDVVPSAFRVKITVTGYCGHILWTGFDKVEEKYPFWCDACDDHRRNGRYPWKLTTEIVPAEPAIAPAPEPPTVWQLRCGCAVESRALFAGAVVECLSHGTTRVEDAPKLESAARTYLLGCGCQVTPTYGATVGAPYVCAEHGDNTVVMIIPLPAATS